MSTVTLDDELLARFRALAAPDQDWDAFVREAARERLERLERAARAEAQAILDGPRLTLEESTARIRRRHNLADLSHLTPDELAQDADRVLALMPPSVREEIERWPLTPQPDICHNKHMSM